MSTISIPAPVTVRRASTTPTTRLRLTRRGRRVLVSLAAVPLAAVVAFSALTGGSALASNSGVGSVSFETVTVMPGDTLWSIASEAAPDTDPRDVIADIMRFNNLSSGMIEAGTTIAIPAQYSR